MCFSNVNKAQDTVSCRNIINTTSERNREINKQGNRVVIIYAKHCLTMVFMLVLETFTLHYTGQGVLLMVLSKPVNLSAPADSTWIRLPGRFCLAVQYEKDSFPEAVLLPFTKQFSCCCSCLGNGGVADVSPPMLHSDFVTVALSIHY